MHNRPDASAETPQHAAAICMRRTSSGKKRLPGRTPSEQQSVKVAVLNGHRVHWRTIVQVMGQLRCHPLYLFSMPQNSWSRSHCISYSSCYDIAVLNFALLGCWRICACVKPRNRRGKADTNRRRSPAWDCRSHSRGSQRWFPLSSLSCNSSCFGSVSPWLFCLVSYTRAFST
jgi:hypothetical protein